MCTTTTMTETLNHEQLPTVYMDCSKREGIGATQERKRQEGLTRETSSDIVHSIAQATFDVASSVQLN